MIRDVLTVRRGGITSFLQMRERQSAAVETRNRVSYDTSYLNAYSIAGQSNSFTDARRLTAVFDPTNSSTAPPDSIFAGFTQPLIRRFIALEPKGELAFLHRGVVVRAKIDPTESSGERIIYATQRRDFGVKIT